MKFCKDEGRTHFLKPWQGDVYALEIPSGKKDRLYLLAQGEPGGVEISCGTARLCEPCSLPNDFFRWMEVDLPASQSAWQLKIRPLSTALAMDNTSGLPVVRIADGTPPEYLTPSYDDQNLPAEKIRVLLPPEFSEIHAPDWKDAWPIALWIQTAWPYRNTFQGRFYCPWRVDEILHWGRMGKSADGTPVIAMCVHYAVAFQQCCLALGTPARVLPLAAHPNSDNGHFVTEIWSRSLQKWVVIDPQAGLYFVDENGHPLNALEVSQLNHPKSRARCGADAPVPENFPYPYAHSRELFQHIGVWRRADFYTCPEQTPPGHGTTAYAETDILWLDHNTHPPMFPCGLKVEDYNAPPGRCSIKHYPTF